MDTKSILKISFLLVILGLILFIPNLGLVHLFDWDEINFAEAAREMLVTGDYLNVRIDFEPFHEKPPLFIWLQAVSMHIFGVSEFAARLPNALIGIITIQVLFYMGRKLYDVKFGLIWVMAFVGSLLPHFYFKTAIIDPTFNLLIYLSIYFLFKISKNEFEKSEYNPHDLFYAGLFCSLGMLTKGPVAYLLIVLTWAGVFFIYRKQAKFPIKKLLLLTLYSSILPLIWYSLLIMQSGSGLVEDFVAYHIRLLTTGDAGHSGPIYYHFVILLLGCFPASVLIFRSFRKQSDDSHSQNLFKIWNFVLLAVVLIIFSIVKTKIVHYSSLAYFPITFLAAYSVYSIVYREIGWKWTTTVMITLIGIVYSALFILFPLALINVEMILPKITDEMTYEVLSSPVHWGGFEYIVGIIFFIGLCISLVLVFMRKYLPSFVALTATIAVTITLFLPLVAPKIEQYTQAAPIEFFGYLAQDDVYLHTLGYKSYVPYYYGEKKYERSRYYLGMSGKEYEQFLLEGDIQSDAYFSAKMTAADNFANQYPELIELYRKNGFVFFKRERIQ